MFYIFREIKKNRMDLGHFDIDFVNCHFNSFCEKMSLWSL